MLLHNYYCNSELHCATLHLELIYGITKRKHARKETERESKFPDVNA